MLKMMKRRRYEEEISYDLSFDDGYGNGFAFPCDSEGNVPDDLNEAARKNLAWCLNHPERFDRFNKVVERRTRYVLPAEGTCSCGETVVLTDQYMGACECPACGQWYSMSGDELLPPNQWGWDGTEW